MWLRSVWGERLQQAMRSGFGQAEVSLKKFTNKLILGIADIDEQHDGLFNLFNEFHDTIQQGKSEVNIESFFSFLKDYVATHFATEENYMEKYAYPEYEFHKSHHEQFIKELEEKQRTFLLEGQKVKLELIVWLYFWFNKHVLSIDKVMGEFLREKMADEARGKTEPSGN